MATLSYTLLRIIARIRPQIWEVVGGGPLGLHVAQSPHTLAARMEPDPVPWRLSPEEAWVLRAQLDVVALTRRIADAASTVQTQGGDGGSFLRAVLDDGWGIEGRPLQLHLPRKWWHGWEEPYPKPNELELLTVMATAGVSFTHLSGQVADPQLQKGLAELGSRLLDQTQEAAGALARNRNSLG